MKDKHPMRELLDKVVGDTKIDPRVFGSGALEHNDEEMGFGIKIVMGNRTAIAKVDYEHYLDNPARMFSLLCDLVEEMMSTVLALRQNLEVWREKNQPRLYRPDGTAL